MASIPLTQRALSAAMLLVVVGSLLPTACASTETQSQTRVEDPVKDKVREQLGSVPARVDTEAADALSTAFRGAADRALPAVVYIEVERENSGRQRQVPDFFRFFFEGPPGGGGPDMEMPPEEGSGSGFIFDEDGHIITNSHVVADAAHVEVRLVDGREFTAKVVGTDVNTDVALIKITPRAGEKLPVAELGSSESLRVGDWVLALGSPLGLDFTVTAGIVSAKGRKLSGRQAALESFIQTDAAINPGNSGGPLVNLSGRVVGINTAIFGGGARFIGYGFAIPVDLVRRIVRDLLEFGVVRRPQLGVQISDVTAVDAEAYGLERVRGADINLVTPDSPAARAGLKPGDVIVALDGAEVENATALTTNLAQRRPGDKVELTYIRDGRQAKVTVTLSEFERADTAQQPRPAGQPAEQTLGFSVEPLTPELAERFGYEGREGVVVSDVTQFGPAASAGLRPGQLILSINKRRVRTPQDVQRIAEEIDTDDVVSLRVQTEAGELVINYRAR
jgi:serine protease Do